MENYLELLYQALIETSDDYLYINAGKIIGVEVLLRWKNKDGDLISPIEFIPILEKHGLIYQTGLWLFKKSLFYQTSCGYLSYCVYKGLS